MVVGHGMGSGWRLIYTSQPERVPPLPSERSYVNMQLESKEATPPSFLDLPTGILFCRGSETRRLLPGISLSFRRDAAVAFAGLLIF